MTTEAATGAGRVYRAAPGLRLRSWGDGSDIVYLPSTRNTHLVDAAAGVLLQALLEGGPGDAPALWARLDPEAEGDEAAATGEDLQMLAERLQQLADTGFVL